MADYQAGDVVARLSIDASQWQRGLQQAQQQLQQFAQQMQRNLPSVTPQVDTTSLQQARAAAQAQAQAARAALQAQVQAGREALQASQQRFQAETQAARAAGQAQVQAARQTLQAHTQASREAQQAAQQRFQAETQAARQAFQTQEREARQAFQAQQQGARQTSSAWQTMLSVAGGIGIATSVSAIVSQVTSLATAAVQAAARMETLRAQFTALQGASRAAVTLDTLFATAQRLGTAFVPLANAFRQFDAATQGTAIEGAKAQRIFEQIRTGMAGMGASSEQASRALLALQQMVSKGTVSQEELRQQLGEALPGAMGIAARALGVTTQELNKLVEKGLDAIPFLQALANQVEREFGGKAAVATNTLTAAWQRFSNELEQLQASLASGTLAGQLRDLTNAATDLLEKLRQRRELYQEAIGGALPALPRGMEGMQDLAARQKDMEALQRILIVAERGFALPGEINWFGGMPTDQQIAEARTKLQDLRKLQDDAIKRMQDVWAAETEPPLVVPGERQAEALRKIQTDLQKELRDLDLTAAFVTPLELAEARLKAMEKSFEAMRKMAPQIGEGFRETLIPTGKPSPFDAIFEAAAAKYRQDPNLLRALGEQESGLRPDVVSRKGAVGIMQIMPATAAQYGAAGANLKDPTTNIFLGARIFEDLMKRFNNDVTKALTAYNAGPGRGGIPLPTGENATFAPDVLRRLPNRPGDILAQTAAQIRAEQLAVEAEKPDTERLAAIREKGREDIAAILERARAREQAITTEISLTQELARVQAFVTGKEETAAAQAQARVRAQGAVMQETIDKALRQFELEPALAERAPALRQHFEDLKAALPGATEAAGLRAFNEALQRDAIAPLENLREKIELTKEERDLLTVAEIRATYADNALVQAQADLSQQSIENRIAYKEEVEALKERFTALKQNADAMREVEEAQERLSTQIRQASMALLPEPETRRASTRLRREAELEGTPLTPDLEAQLEALDELEAQTDRVRYAAELYRDLAQGVGDAWFTALEGIVSGTQSVSEAFKEMGRSILQTMAQIAQQEATRAFIRLGLNLLTGAATSSLTTPAPAAGAGGAATGTLVGSVLGGGGAQPGGGAPFSFGSMLGGGGGADTVPLFGLQHGGIVNRPTRALIGERGPEAIFNKSQMQALFQLTPSAGGQAAGGSPVTIINVATKAQAEQEAASQRAMGHQVIINEVMADLGKGESSSINRMIRTLAR